MTIYVGYVGAKSCTSGPQPGNVELLNWFLAAYKAQGAHSDGIYNCRPVRGGTTLSVHGEGRATDLGIPGPAPTWDALADFLLKYSKELGVQCVIYDRRIWSGAHPYEAWRAYTGSDPHTGHLHVELAWAAAAGSAHLTAARIAAVKAGVTPPAPPKPANTDKPKVVAHQKQLEITADGLWGPITDEWSIRLRTAAYGKTGGGPHKVFSVKSVQKVIDTREDGIWGPLSQAALERWVKTAQGTFGVHVDGFWGPNTDHAWWTLRSRVLIR